MTVNKCTHPNSDYILPGAYDFKVDALAGTVTYRVPTSSVRPEDIVENLSVYFEDDKLNTLPEGVNLDRPPAVRPTGDGEE